MRLCADAISVALVDGGGVGGGCVAAALLCMLTLQRGDYVNEHGMGGGGNVWNVLSQRAQSCEPKHTIPHNANANALHIWQCRTHRAMGCVRLCGQVGGMNGLQQHRRIRVCVWVIYRSLLRRHPNNWRNSSVTHRSRLMNVEWFVIFSQSKFSFLHYVCSNAITIYVLP